MAGILRPLPLATIKKGSGVAVLGIHGRLHPRNELLHETMDVLSARGGGLWQVLMTY
jgi:hypothetical protein